MGINYKEVCEDKRTEGREERVVREIANKFR